MIWDVVPLVMHTLLCEKVLYEWNFNVLPVMWRRITRIYSTTQWPISAVLLSVSLCGANEVLISFISQEQIKNPSKRCWIEIRMSIFSNFSSSNCSRIGPFNCLKSHRVVVCTEDQADRIPYWSSCKTKWIYDVYSKLDIVSMY